MGCCDFNVSCHFLNVATVTLPLTTAHAKLLYCIGDFTNCTIYKIAKTHGIDKVPRYVLPADKYELQSRIVENRQWSKMLRW